MARLKVIVIGGGPAGLVSLKFLATAHHFYLDIQPIDVQLFEAEDQIGGTFTYRVWNGAELVSSKYLTTFSDFRIPDDAPDFLGPEEYVQYLVNYAKHFKILSHIRCRTVVCNVRRQQSGSGHVVTTLDRNTMKYEEHQCDAVLVCSGLNLTPNIPESIENLIAPLASTTKGDKPTVLQSRTRSNWAIGNDANFKPDVDGVSWMNWISSQETSSSPHGIRVLHSCEFKNRHGAANEFLSPDGKPSTVVILGAGETAHDIAALAVNSPGVGRVLMCHRDGFFVAPKVTPEPVIMHVWGRPYPGKRPNKPLDTAIASLFDTAYVPPILQRGQLLWQYYNYWVRWMFWVIAGTPAGYDQWAGGVSDDRNHVDSYFFVKTEKAIPYISAPYRGGIVNAIRSFFINIPLKDVGDKEIELAPWPTRVSISGSEQNGVHGSGSVAIMEFPDDGSPECERLRANNSKLGPVKPDMVIFATGYRREFPFLSQEYPSLRECSMRGVYEKIEDGFAYIGFIRPAIGAIPPLAELQAQLWISRFIDHHTQTNSSVISLDTYPATTPEGAVPQYEVDYRLHPRGGYDFFQDKHGVDHESYAYQLALDMGAAPTASHVLRRHGWKVFFTWAMGPNFNTKFRLVGPWADPEEAAEIMRTELFNVVKRTGGIVFFVTYTLVPQVLFGLLSLLIFLGNMSVSSSNQGRSS